MRHGAAAIAVVALACASVPAAASEASLRVIVPEAAVRSGPGPRFREVYRAQRDEVFEVLERATLGYWFRVLLPDGTHGWIEGEQTVPVEVDVEATGVFSRAWAKIKATLFAPSPINPSHVGLTFSGGAVGGDGAFFFRPAIVVDPHLAIEGHAGEAVGSDGAIFLYGVGLSVIIWPEGPLVPFVHLGGGGATSVPRVNGVAQTAITQSALDAGGGLMLVIRKRLVLRADVRNYTLFTPNATQNRQEYSGGLAVFF